MGLRHGATRARAAAREGGRRAGPHRGPASGAANRHARSAELVQRAAGNRATRALVARRLRHGPPVAGQVRPVPGLRIQANFLDRVTAAFGAAYEAIAGWLAGPAPNAGQQAAPVPAAAVPAPAAAVPAPAPPQIGPFAPGSAPALQQARATLDRIRDAGARVTRAATGLPVEIRRRFPANADPQFVTNTFDPILRNLRQAGVFDDASNRQADHDARQLEAAAGAYEQFCADVDRSLRQAAGVYVIYRNLLSAPQHQAFDDIARHVYDKSETADQIAARCVRFGGDVRDGTLLTADGLRQLAQADATRPQAARHVTSYFEDGRLVIRGFRAGYASRFDQKRFDFGCELNITAREGGLKSIQKDWVFHSHARTDDRTTFTLKRGMGANHLKLRDDPTGPISINFDVPATFDAVERDEDTQAGFRRWLLRGGEEAVRNTAKRRNR